MEYRVPYRDLPWGVAFCVLPGKIIGTFIIKPIVKIEKNFKKYLLKFLWTSVVILLLGCVLFLIQELTDDTFFKWILHIWDSFWALFESEPEAVVNEVREAMIP